MEKKLKYLVLIIILAILAASAWFFIYKQGLTFNEKTPVHNNVINTNSTTTATSTVPKVSMTPEAVAARKAAADYFIMSLDERKEFKIPRGVRAEVLRRDKEGKITDYKIIPAVSK